MDLQNWSRLDIHSVYVLQCNLNPCSSCVCSLWCGSLHVAQTPASCFLKALWSSVPPPWSTTGKGRSTDMSRQPGWPCTFTTAPTARRVPKCERTMHQIKHTDILLFCALWPLWPARSDCQEQISVPDNLFFYLFLLCLPFCWILPLTKLGRWIVCCQIN